MHLNLITDNIDRRSRGTDLVVGRISREFSRVLSMEPLELLELLYKEMDLASSTKGGRIDYHHLLWLPVHFDLYYLAEFVNLLGSLCKAS